MKNKQFRLHVTDRVFYNESMCNEFQCLMLKGRLTYALMFYYLMRGERI